MAVLNHDDDVLEYALYRRGVLLDTYNSWPDYWEEKLNIGEAVNPAGGNSQLLCEAFGFPGNTSEVDRILTAPENSGEFTFAAQRHSALLRALHWL